MSFSEELFSIDEEAYNMLYSHLSELGKEAVAGEDHVYNPIRYMQLAEIAEEYGLLEWSQYFEKIADEIAREICDYTGYKWNKEAKRFYDPESGRFVENPATDPEWLADKEFVERLILF